MRLTTTYNGVRRTFSGIKPSVVNLYISTMSTNHIGGSLRIEVEDDHDQVRSIKEELYLVELDIHAGEA